jgi:hypothetical protein
MHLALPSSMDLLWSRLGNVLRSLIYHRTKIVRNCFKSLYSWVAPPPLHAQALARGPLAAVRLHRTVGSGTARAAVRRRRRRCCQRGRTPAASRRLPGQRQRQAPSTATRPPSFGIHAESGVPLVVFHLYKSLRCNKGERLDGKRARAVVSYGRTLCQNTARRHGQRRSTAWRCGGEELPEGSSQVSKLSL